MKHMTEREMQGYLIGEWDGKRREDFEAHLYSCDQCLEIYLQSVEQQNDLPRILDDSSFTNDVMAQITKKVPFYKKAGFHYVLAAAATILMMMSGVFQSLTKYTDTVQNPQVAVQQPSVTEGIMDKTFTWVDSFEKNKEGTEE